MKDLDYLKFVRTLPCAVKDCRCRNIEAHHRIGHNRREDYANKASDGEAIPLCKKHHDELHDHGWRTFEAKYNLNQLKIAINTLITYLLYMKSMENCPI